MIVLISCGHLSALVYEIETIGTDCRGVEMYSV